MAPLDPLPPLTEEQYATCFNVFLGTSSEHIVALDWIRSHLIEKLPRTGLKILSVGAGDGRFDISVCSSLVERRVAIQKYQMIEPGEKQVRAIHELLARSPCSDLMSALEGKFEDYMEVDGYDAVVFAHSLYYLPDRPLALGKALSLLRSGGFILVLHQTETGISQIQKRFSLEVSGHSKWSFNMQDLIEIHRSMPVQVESWQLSHWIDMEKIDRNGNEGDQLLSFFLEADLSHANRTLNARIWEYIDSLAGSDRTPYRLLHPLGIAIIRPLPNVAQE